MAKVLNPLLSTDARGSIGGITYSINRGINTCKVKPRPARRFRTTQPRNRAILSFTSTYYQELTSAQRTAWQEFAQDHPEPDGFGGTFLLTGHQAFVKLNHTAIRLADWGSIGADPPGSPIAATIDALTVSTGLTLPGDIDLVWTNQGTGSADDFVEQQIAGPFTSAAKQSVESRFKFVQTVAGNILLDTLAGLTELHWYWVRARYVSAAGQTSPWQYGHAQPKVTV